MTPKMEQHYLSPISEKRRENYELERKESKILKSFITSVDK